MARRKTAGTVKVNFKGVEGRNNAKEGDYLCEVLEFKPGQSSNKNDQLELVAEIAKGEFKGYKGYMYFPLQENSLWKLHAFLTCLGEEVPDDDMDIDPSEMVGKQFMGVFTPDTYNGKKKAKLTDFDSVDNYKGGDDEDEKKDKKKKDKKSKDEPADDEPKGKSKKDKDGKKKDKKKSEPEDEPKGKKDKGKKEKPKKYDKDEVEDMDEDELAAVVKAAKLDVDLKSIKKLPKKVAAVLEALEEEDLLDD